MKSFHWRYNYVGFHSSNFVEIMFVFIYFLWNQGEKSGRYMAQIAQNYCITNTNNTYWHKRKAK